MRRALLVLALLPSLGRAAPPEYTDEQRRELVDRLLGDRIQKPGAGEEELQQMRALRAAQALDHLKVLLQRSPNDAELHYLAGLAWNARADERGLDLAPPDLVQHAIDELLIARRIAPDGPHQQEIASLLGLLHSDLGQYDAALAEYDRAINLTVASSLGDAEDRELATLYGNSAESLMALGRLEEAIARYRASLPLARGDGDNTALAWYGLAVALDRDEQVEKAREAVRQALAHDKRDAPLDGVLHHSAVFFRPVGDKWYYMALGFLGHDQPRAAADAFAKFLAAQPSSRYARRARAHLAELAKPAAAAAARKLRVNVAVLEGSSNRDAHHEAELAAGRLATCFAVPPAPTGEAIVDLSDDPRLPFLRVGVYGGDGASVTNDTADCVAAVARGWRELLDGRGRARVLLHVEQAR